MVRATRIVTTVVASCAAVAVLTSTAVLAATPRGTLTSAEYRQLSAATAALNRSASAKAINWTGVRVACRSIGGASALLRTQRSSCLDSMDALEALANFPAEQARCAAAATGKTGTATGTATTGTTTTGASPAQSAVIQTIICLNPRYQALDRYAKAIHSSDTAARKQALARGFTGICLATLASTPADLRKETSFSSSAAKLAGDVALLIKVTRGKAPPSDLNQIQIDNDITRFERTARAVLDEQGPQKLSACRHE